jgi:gliding motility-associated-like protein
LRLMIPFPIMKKLVVFAVLFSAISFARAQYTPISQAALLNTCTGTFTDDGEGGQYTDTPYTMTICPDNPGDVIQVNFAAFNLQTSPGNGNNDVLYVYDGTDDTAMPLGPYSGAISNLQITATVNNTSGCLTFVFDPNGPANVSSPGWEAQILCTTPCANPTLGSTITNPLPTGAEQSVSVCIGSDVSFSGATSSPAPTFNIANYAWDFADGSTGSGVNVTHSYNAPGEYVVNLTVTDNNGCNNVNVIPLQVLVSTVPTFTGMQDLSTCLGDTLLGMVAVGDNSLIGDDTNIGGSAAGTTWTALPPQVVIGQTYLADGAGFSFSSDIVYDFFDPGQVLLNCEDLWGVMVNMEHSYAGDVSINITCPNGTTVDLVTYPSGGGGTYLGEAVDDGFGASATEPGVGYEYEWVTNSPNGTWTDAFTAGIAGGNVIQNSGGNPVGNSLAPGQYNATGNLCDLVGCPLNGAWTFSVLDNLGADNGYIFEWGLNLNPALYPGVTTFTPTIGSGADSSYWVTTGPDSGIQWIESISNDRDVIEIFPQAVGVYDFTYHVLNSFGCTFDTTIQVTVSQAPLVSAGSDLTLLCPPAQLNGGLQNDPVVPCASCGNYNYCYVPFDFYMQTYCPDNAGDGFVSVSFLSGSTGANDFVYVYNGPDTWPSPQIGSYTGDLTGLNWTSTDPSGCLTFYISEWDGVGNCQDGGAQELVYSVTAGSAASAGFIWEWSPNNPLDYPNTQDPTVLGLNSTTTFTLTGYPAGYRGCASSDAMIVSVDPLGSPGEDASLSICPTSPSFDLIDALNGTPAAGGTWYFGGAAIADVNFDPLLDTPGDYEYVISLGPTCQNSATVTIDMPLPTVITVADDTTLCDAGTAFLNMISLSEGQAPFQYNWTYNGATVSAQQDFTLAPTSSGEACLTVTDDCDYAVSQCFMVDLLPPITPSFTGDTTAGCWPDGFVLTIENDPSEYASSQWTISNGSVLLNMSEAPISFEAPGTYGVQLKLTNIAGCQYTIANDAYLTSFAPPVADYTVGPQPTNIFNTELHFESNTTGYPIADYAWIFTAMDGSLVGGSAAANPVFAFPDQFGGIYNVNLQVTDIHNCSDVVYGGTVEIDDITQFYIPTGFTPNGDGLNDVLFFEGADIDAERFSLEIFNRFGELVFETKNPELPWTGNIKGGEYFAPNGAYSWKSIIVSKSTGAKKELSGSVILMR